MDELNQKLLPFPTRKNLSFDPNASFDIEVEQMAGVAGEITISGLTKDGIFTFVDTHDGDNTVFSKIFGVTDIPIALTVNCTTATVSRGDYWVTVYLRINQERVMKLCAGYVSRQNAISFPLQDSETNLTRPGFIKSVTGTDRAANTEISETVPDNVAWELKSFIATLVADANAATRKVRLAIGDGTNTVMEIAFNGTQAAGETRIYSAVQAGSVESSSAGSTKLAPLPSNLILPAGFTIATITDSIQVGDNWSAPILLVEEFKVGIS